MTTDYFKWTAMAWLRNGQELDVAIMHRAFSRLGIRLAAWDRYENAKGYTLRLTTQRSPAEIIAALSDWIAKDWMWTGQHTVYVSCPSADCAWHYLTYTIEVVKSPSESARFTINEKID